MADLEAEQIAESVRAIVTYVSETDGSELIEVNGHKFQFGGQGDGYCYAHQSFDCLDNITEVERAAIQQAEQFDGPGGAE